MSLPACSRRQRFRGVAPPEDGLSRCLKSHLRRDDKCALAHLQLSRAYALEGETAKAKASYQDFLTLWKDAEPISPSCSKPRRSMRGCNRPPDRVPVVLVCISEESSCVSDRRFSA